MIGSQDLEFRRIGIYGFGIAGLEFRVVVDDARV